MKEKNFAERIRNGYLPKTTEQTKLQALKELDHKVKYPVRVFSYIFGSVGSLVFGTGLCIAMGVVGGLMPVGIALGLVGGAVMGVTYPLHNKILNSRKEKYASEIVEKSNAIIEGYVPQEQKQVTRVYENQTNYSYNKTNNLER